MSDQVAEVIAKYIPFSHSREDGKPVLVGYKQTEHGLIPKEWEYKSIGEIASVFSGGTPNRKIAEYWGGNVPWVTTTLIDGGEIISAREFITQKGLEGSSSKWCKAGTILLAMYGQGKTRGKAAILRIDATINQACAAIDLKDTSSNQYILHILNSMYEEIRELSNSGGQENLSSGIIKSIPIPYPPKKEQTAIANALSDVDALISELEKLITKKQAIKTATMQQLLTGRTRLPQFALCEDGSSKGYKSSELGEVPEDWEVCLLQNAVDFLDGMRRPIKSGDRAKITGIYPYYGASGIVDYVNDYIFDDELILLGEDGENILSRSLPLAFEVSGKIWVNNHAHVMKPKEDFDITYLTEFLESLDFSILNSGTAQPKLNKQSCLKIKVAKPTKQEQTAIATILSDMDSDIQALEQRLSKTRQIKQGMMQELLTGKTRLIKGENA